MSNECIHVLLIEDNPGDGELIKLSLRTANTQFDVCWSVTMSDALKQLAVHDFDVILADLHLPDACGLAVVTAIRQQVADVPIVVLTGLASDDVALEALDEGAQELSHQRSLNPRSLRTRHSLRNSAAAELRDAPTCGPAADEPRTA